MAIELEDRYRGTIYGLAIGDALGKPTEFLGLGAIQRQYGPQGIQEPPEDGLYTDDTQMTIALAEGLLDSKVSSDPNASMASVAKRFVAWSTSKENNRAPGGTCMTACQNLSRGTPWREAGVRDSKGCGAAMRVAPLGLLYGDRRELRELSHASSLVTHGHPTALAATHGAALTVRFLLEQIDPTILLGELELETGGDSEEWDEVLEKVPVALDHTLAGKVTPMDVQQKGDEPWRLGEAWVAEEAVASALYCFLLACERGEGYEQVVRYGANTRGDSDSIACIAGGFAGACWGVGAIPPGWVERIEHRAYLGKLADRLFAGRRA